MSNLKSKMIAFIVSRGLNNDIVYWYSNLRNVRKSLSG
jgi:hypothetical protein